MRKSKIKVGKFTYREFVRRRRRRREVDVEGHGATESWAEMLVPLVESSKHLGAADLTWFGIHLPNFPMGQRSDCVLWRIEGVSESSSGN